jgi:DNA-binding protein
MTGTLPLAAMETILKNNGAQRVSNDAKEALRDVLEEAAKEIAEKAARIAKHTGRTTIKAEDIKLAVK